MMLLIDTSIDVLSATCVRLCFTHATFRLSVLSILATRRVEL